VNFAGGKIEVKGKGGNWGVAKRGPVFCLAVYKASEGKLTFATLKVREV
jgi:hypothetical protein